MMALDAAIFRAPRSMDCVSPLLVGSYFRQVMAAVGEKRVLEEAETALAVEEQPDAKIAKVEGSEEPATVSGSEAAEDAAAAPVADDSEVTIGYKTMSGAQTQAYFQDLLSNLRRYQSLNEYEHHMVCELVKLGHPDAERKLAGGVRAVQVRDTEHEGATSKCFFLIHEDGKVEDVSY
ncbi:hypothetical protein H632_c1835p1, partial [Helicosporidium sp. ATCC 50920]